MMLDAWTHHDLDHNGLPSCGSTAARELTDSVSDEAGGDRAEPVICREKDLLFGANYEVGHVSADVGDTRIVSLALGAEGKRWLTSR
jgi:hypothetical protein